MAFRKISHTFIAKLKSEGLTTRQVVEAAGVHRNTVNKIFSDAATEYVVRLSQREVIAALKLVKQKLKENIRHARIDRTLWTVRRVIRDEFREYQILRRMKGGIKK